jgi:hypothetical protein
MAAGVRVVESEGVGLTVMVKVLVGPGQLTPPLVNVGVTTIDATTVAVVTLVAVKDAIFPAPLAASPMLAAEFVHE